MSEIDWDEQRKSDIEVAAVGIRKLSDAIAQAVGCSDSKRACEILDNTFVSLHHAWKPERAS